MTRDQVQETVLEIISQRSEIPKEKLKLECVLSEDLGLDSFRLSELIFALEQTFNMNILAEETERIKTIEDAVNFIYKNCKNCNK